MLFRKKTFASVWHWLQRLGVPLRDRRDVAQDVFLAAHSSFHTYNPERARPERWLNKITVHISAHYRDRAQHRREELTADDELHAVDDRPRVDERMSREQERLLVLELLQQIDLDVRAVLIAHDIDGISMAEIAEQRGIPISTAYKWRARAFAAFQQAVEQRRLEERQKEGRGMVIPFDIAALLAADRIIPDAPELMRLDVIQRVHEAIAAQHAAAGAGTLADAWSLSGGVGGSARGLGAPLVGVPLAAAAAVVAWLWLNSSPDPRFEVAGPASAEQPAVAAVTLQANPSWGQAPEPVAPPQPAAQQQATSTVSPARWQRVPSPPPARPAPAAAPVAPDYRLLAELQRDLALFESCVNAVEHQDGRTALARLRRHERDVPRSHFTAEREVLWVRALLLLGRMDEARARAASAGIDFPPGAKTFPPL